MNKCFFVWILILFAMPVQAHQPDVSTTVLVEKASGEWWLEINTALTAFQYELEASAAAEHTSPEAFKQWILDHVKRNIWICFNQQDTIDLQNGTAQLGHESNIQFQLQGVPERIEEVRVKNTSFANVDESQSTLMILRPGEKKVQLTLNAANQHSAHLKAIENQLVGKTTSSPFSETSIFVFILILLAIVIAIEGVYLYKGQGQWVALLQMKEMGTLATITLAILLMSCLNQTQRAAPEASEALINDLARLGDHYGAYRLVDQQFGTETIVTIEGNQRKMVTNAIPNHTTGTFPNPGNPNRISAQRLTYTFPLQPVYTGKPKWAREPGVALNGVKFEPQTAEVVICDSGENYRVEAIQNLIDLGLDFNNAHVQPTGAYHYHGTPKGVVEAFDSEEDLVHIGFAKDGFPIYYSKSGAYQPSFRLIDDVRSGTDCTYSNPMENRKLTINGTALDGTFVSDWEYVKGLGDLDECNGAEVDGQYRYFVTDIYPYVGRCLMGEFKESRRRGPPPRGRRPGGGPPPNHPPRN